MAPFLSVLTLRSPPGRLDEAIGQFEARGVLQACRDAVPGFVCGRLLRSLDDGDSACVICGWTDRAAFEQWTASPLRGAGGTERIVEPAGRSAVFALVRVLHR